ncbi:uncharacterized protein B0H18DRAFT_1034780 [Fomitopsis serialis]|uniref:uncharacterized protein n=1 Tax=Fomitopsis serialis TaxID=139415 RepID=UPI00200863A5|nr:uncharacterized protein B0H18DRAFT_1034780 [Neoantrodia serialis]KAH9917457.1 hypothetical protein B0H18DRAFT_1034780 [Neoantrodia serialis]
MPPRAAAQKASKLAAAQLESSPPPSDDRRALEFGEPSKPRTPVKVTYGRKRRGYSSPTKSSDADGSPGKERNVGKRMRSSLSALASMSAEKPSRGGSSAESPILLSDDEGEDDEVIEPQSPLLRKASSGKARGRILSAKKPSGTVSRKGKSNAAASSNNNPAKRDRAMSISSTSSLSDLDESDLTSLSSRSPGPSIMAPPARARSASTLTSLTSSQVGKSVGGLRRTDSVATLGDSSVDDEAWSLGKLGTLAWVKVDGSGDVVDEGGNVSDGDTYWWPAKVTHPRDPVKISLFGDGPRLSSDDAAGIKELTVSSPSASNILPMASRGRIRFTERSYRAAERGDTAVVPPRKRRKLGVDTRWREARDLMLQEDEDANEGLPMLLSSHFSRDASFSVKAPSAGGSKAVEMILSDDDDLPMLQEKPWRPPPCDPSLELPGELVLAKEKKPFTDYWPAKLLEYIPPTNPKQRPRYKAEFYDGMIKNIDSDWFFTVEHKQFKSCKLGRDMFNYGLEEERDDVAAPLRNDTSDIEISDEDALRPLTPEPPMPPLEDFEDTSLAEQFEYIKPVLAARHDQFMRGAAARRAVCESGYTRGSLKQDEVEELLRLVRRWAAKWEKRHALGIPDGDPHKVPETAGGSACVNASQVPSVDNPIEVPLTPVRQPAESETELAVSEVAVPPPSGSEHVTLDVDANAHESPLPDETSTIPPSNARPPVSGGSDIIVSSPEKTAAASVPVDEEPHISEREILPAHNGSQRPRPKLSFKDLSTIDQITYCQNILLHEAVLQLLLWRSGERSSVGLLIEEEERRLHDIAFEKANESDWVHEIIRLKQAAEGKLLPWANKDKDKASAASPESFGGTRTRSKRV